VYEQLPAAGISWERVRLFWGDERFVPANHQASNYRMARESLLERIRPPEDNAFPIPTDVGSLLEAARRYERTLRGLFPGVSFPAFDLVLLGIGAAVRERITLTLPVLNASRCVAFLVTGEDKRNALSALLAPGAVAGLPAQLVRAVRSGLHEDGELYCFMDLHGL